MFRRNFLAGIPALICGLFITKPIEARPIKHEMKLCVIPEAKIQLKYSKRKQKIVFAMQYDQSVHPSELNKDGIQGYYLNPSVYINGKRHRTNLIDRTEYKISEINIEIVE